MKKTAITATIAFAGWVSGNAQPQEGGYPISPVPFTSVKVTDTFWGERLRASREVTIPLAFDKCEETGRYDNFLRAANPSPDHKPSRRPFDDTDVYKTIEGASYSMQTYPDKALERYIDSILLIVAAAQEPDGYLFTALTMNPDHPHEWVGKERWGKVEDLSHEFYNLGHMIEGAIAHYQATGKRNFLDIAIRYADCVDREIGDDPGKLVRVPGHQIAEMALAKLYLVTGEKRYLDLAKFFLDKRGYTSRKDAYSQAHKPVLEQDEAVGHAVRAVYMYSGMADVAALTGDEGYIEAIGRIWDNITQKKIYLTGGLGASRNGEAFGQNYNLPNLTAYNETCAAIGSVYWNHRLFLLHGDAKYYDVLERTLYNGLISGVSLDGGTFFYPNPLEADGVYGFNYDRSFERQPWFGTSCCPSNLARFIPSLPGYVYAVDGNDLYVNLFMGNTSQVEIGGKSVGIAQTTNYPWDGAVRLEITEGRQDMALKIRIPGWVRGEVVPGSDLYTYTDAKQLGYSVKVNGLPVKSAVEKGYFTIGRTWRKGDVVEIDFEMQPRMVVAHEKVEADRDRVAIERGPLVYCAEFVDNVHGVRGLLLPDKPLFTVEKKADLLNGVTMIKTEGQSLAYDDKGYVVTRPVTVSLVPYYAWCHRGVGEMLVWLPQDVGAVHPGRD
jgi:DUF1680 family protein